MSAAKRIMVTASRFTDAGAIDLARRRLRGAASHLISCHQAREILLSSLLRRFGFRVDELVLKNRQTIRIVLP